MGKVQSYSINSNGLSGPIDTVDTGGDGPAFCVQLSSGVVAAMNYGSGNGSFTRTSIDGKTFELPSSFVNFPPSPNVSHPHMALGYGEEIFVSDLVSVVLLPFFGRSGAINKRVSDLRWSSTFNRVRTKFGASTAVVIRFTGQFHSQREVAPGILPFTV